MKVSTKDRGKGPRKPSLKIVRVSVAAAKTEPCHEKRRLWRGQPFDQETGAAIDDPFRPLYGTPEEAKARIQRSTDAKSDALPDDPFMGSYGVSVVGACPILSPPDDPRYLASLAKVSSSLRSCVDAQVQSVVGYGYELVEREGMAPTSDGEEQERADEKLFLEDFFDNIHPHMSWVEIKRRRETDCELTGRGFLEIIDKNDETTGESTLFGFGHLPTRNMRLSTEDKDPVLAKAWRFDRKERNWKEVEYYHRFRRFVNVATNIVGGPTIRYFTEFGDPRFVNKNTGAFFTKSVEGKEVYITEWKDLTAEQRALVANQVWPKFVYDSEQPQGAPRWLAAKLDIEAAYSSREAVWDYLENGAIPQLLLLVSGGAAFEDAVQKVEEALDRTQGNHAANRVVVLDAMTVQGAASGGALPADGVAPPSAMKIEAVKLNDLQRGDDAMFLKFGERVDLNVRKCFRFGSLFVGDNDGATYATAEVILQLAEMQCFGPAREEDDWRMNHLVFPRLRAKWWKYRSKGPRIENPDIWAKIVDLGIQSGAIKDYETLCAILSEKLGRHLDVPRDDKGDPLPWTKLPPGFVVALVRILGATPSIGDIDAATAGLQADGSGADKGTQGRSTGAELVAQRVAELMMRANEIATGRAKGGRSA